MRLIEFLRFWLLRPPPTQARDEESWRTWLAQRVILVMLLASGGWVLICLVTLNPTPLGISGKAWPWVVPIANLLMAAGSLWALRRLEQTGQRNRVALLWTASLWLYGAALNLGNGSLRSGLILGVLLLMIASALLLNHRAFTWFAALGVATIIAIARLDLYTGGSIYRLA